MSNLINELVDSIKANEAAPFAALRNRNHILHQIIRSEDLRKPALLAKPKEVTKITNLNMNDKLIHDWVLADIQALSSLKGKEKNEATNIIKDNLSVYTVYMKKLQSVDYGLCQELLKANSQLNGFCSITQPPTAENTELTNKQDTNLNQSNETSYSNLGKKNILESVTYEANNDGSVNYFLNKNHIFTDYGQNILMAKGADEQEEAIHAALLLAKEKYFGKFELTGTEEFKSKAIEILAKNQIKVTLCPEKYNVQLMEHYKQINSSAEDNGIQSPTSTEPLAKKTLKRRFR